MALVATGINSNQQRGLRFHGGATCGQKYEARGTCRLSVAMGSSPDGKTDRHREAGSEPPGTPRLPQRTHEWETEESSVQTTFEMFLHH